MSRIGSNDSSLNPLVAATEPLAYFTIVTVAVARMAAGATEDLLRHLLLSIKMPETPSALTPVEFGELDNGTILQFGVPPSRTCAELAAESSDATDARAAAPVPDL
jgi:hypothetical protein